MLNTKLAFCSTHRVAWHSKLIRGDFIATWSLNNFYTWVDFGIIMVGKVLKHSERISGASTESIISGI